MAAAIGNSGPFSYTRVLFCRAVNPAVTQAFYRYANTKPDQPANKVKISPEFEKWYSEKRAEQEQKKLRRLKDREILGGLPKPGDRFYSASWEMLAQENKSKP